MSSSGALRSNRVCNAKRILESIFLVAMVVLSLQACAPKAKMVVDGEMRSSYLRLLRASVILLREDTPTTLLQAAAGFELLVEMDASDPRGWDGLASVAIRLGEFDSALRYLEVAMKVAPRYAPAYAHRGYIAEFQREHSEAEKWYLRALSLDPRNGVARIGMARISADQHEAQSHLRKLDLLQALR